MLTKNGALMLRYTTSRTMEFQIAETPPAMLDYRTDLVEVDLCRPEHTRAAVPANSIGSGPNSNCLATRLNAFVRFDEEEAEALAMLGRNAKASPAEQILIHEGNATDSIYLIVSGLGCRFKMLADGRRQILGYLIPGDLCDMQLTVASTPDYCVGLISNSMVARIPSRTMIELIARYPRIGRALTMASIVDSVILREWLLSIGQRDALQKLSHLFCEMAVRLEAIGAIAEDGSFELPVNQVTLADTLGLTSVHINRTLQRLRSDGLIRFCHRRLTILDRERLKVIAGFEGDYLKMRSTAV